MIAKHWGVDISVNCEYVLHIGSDCLSGESGIEEHAETIRHAARSLLSFIGEEPDVETDPKSCPLYMDFKKSCRALAERTAELEKNPKNQNQGT